MNIEEAREYCLAKKGVTEGLPFGPDALVFKVLGKMFATLSMGTDTQMNLKCDPEKAEELRAQYPYIIPGYHMNKKHWNTVVFEGATDDRLVEELIDHSYDLVVAKLKKADREALKELD